MYAEYLSAPVISLSKAVCVLCVTWHTHSLLGALIYIVLAVLFRQVFFNGEWTQHRCELIVCLSTEVCMYSRGTYTYLLDYVHNAVPTLAFCHFCRLGVALSGIPA